MTKKNIDKVVSYLEDHTWRDTAEHFKISEMTISRYLKRYKMINHINDDNYTNLLKKGFNKLLKKSLYDMSAVELKMIYFLITNISKSMRKEQYISKITKIVGVKTFVKF